MANSPVNPLEMKSDGQLKGGIPAMLFWCGFFLIIGLSLTVIGFSQDRTVFLQIGLVLSALSAFCGIVRITVWGSK